MIVLYCVVILLHFIRKQKAYNGKITISTKKVLFINKKTLDSPRMENSVFEINSNLILRPFKPDLKALCFTRKVNSKDIRVNWSVYCIKNTRNTVSI